MSHSFGVVWNHFRHLNVNFRDLPRFRRIRQSLTVRHSLSLSYRFQFLRHGTRGPFNSVVSLDSWHGPAAWMVITARILLAILYEFTSRGQIDGTLWVMVWSIEKVLCETWWILWDTSFRLLGFQELHFLKKFYRMCIQSYPFGGHIIQYKVMIGDQL